MLNFIKAMLKAKPVFKEESMGIRNYNHLETKSDYKLSVQCSAYHYCSPRKLLGINHYDKYELAIFKNNKFVYPDMLDNFPRKNELDTLFEGQIFGYVPKDLVEDLYNYLNLELEAVNNKISLEFDCNLIKSYAKYLGYDSVDDLNAIKKEITENLEGLIEQWI